MNDFYEIMDFCGFDLEKANEMAKKQPLFSWMNEAVQEALEEVGLEAVESESAGT